MTMKYETLASRERASLKRKNTEAKYQLGLKGRIARFSFFLPKAQLVNVLFFFFPCRETRAESIRISHCLGLVIEKAPLLVSDSLMIDTTRQRCRINGQAMNLLAFHSIDKLGHVVGGESKPVFWETKES